MFQDDYKLHIINSSSGFLCQFEPWHDKTNKISVQPAKTQISLGIHPIWSESLLCAQWVVKDPSLLHADSKDSDQTGRMPRLICVWHTVILLVLSCRGSCHVPKFSDRQFWANSVDPDQTALRWVVWSGSTLSAVEPHCYNFRIITTIFRVSGYCKFTIFHENFIFANICEFNILAKCLHI